MEKPVEQAARVDLLAVGGGAEGLFVGLLQLVELGVTGGEQRAGEGTEREHREFLHGPVSDLIEVRL